MFCADDLLHSRHTFRAWWPAVLWNGLLLFGGTKGYSQMMTMSSNNIRVQNNPIIVTEAGGERSVGLEAFSLWNLNVKHRLSGHRGKYKNGPLTLWEDAG